MCPVYDLICENDKCQYEDKGGIWSWKESKEQICPKCGSKLRINYSTFKHKLKGVT